MRTRILVIIVVTAAALAVASAYLGAAAVVLDVALTPHRVHCDVPKDLGAPIEATTLASTTDGTRIAAWLAGAGREKAVVLVHGLDSCGWHGAAPMVAKRYLDAGFSVGVLDLRGQGDSGGEHLGLGWHERGDVEAVVRALQARGSKRIGIHGSSYGAATALLSTAAIADVKAVVADSSFADIRDLMDAELRRKVGGGAGVLGPGVVVVGVLLHGLDLSEIAPVQAIRTITVPISLLHGEDDDRIPVEHARRLQAATHGADLWVLPHAGHTVAMDVAREEYFRRTVDFLAAKL
jgi:uncharacterized protein